jgi:hypothetical protein
MKAYLSPSNFSKIMTTSRGGKGFGQTALTYADEIILDILQVERYQTTAKSLIHGIDNEILAKDAYQQFTMNTITDVPEAIMHQKFNFIGGTPDGLIGDYKIIEIKCPWNPINHLNNYVCNNIQVDEMPDSYLADYWWQVQGYLWITERHECDFVTYDPRFPEHLSLIITNVLRNDDDIHKLSERCQEFWHEIVQQKLTMFV